MIEGDRYGTACAEIFLTAAEGNITRDANCRICIDIM